MTRLSDPDAKQGVFLRLPPRDGSTAACSPLLRALLFARLQLKFRFKREKAAMYPRLREITARSCDRPEIALDKNANKKGIY